MSKPSSCWRAVRKTGTPGGARTITAKAVLHAYDATNLATELYNSDGRLDSRSRRPRFIAALGIKSVICLRDPLRAGQRHQRGLGLLGCTSAIPTSRSPTGSIRAFSTTARISYAVFCLQNKNKDRGTR